MKRFAKPIMDVFKITLGCALFGIGFNLFLAPNNLNAGGLSGLAMVLVHLIGKGSVGTITMLMNIPLFLLAGIKIGKKFFVGSLLGMLLSSVFLDVFALLPVPETEPLIGALYGSVISGVGFGLVFTTGASTGGSDIVVRLLKYRYKSVPIGFICTCFDVVVVTLSGIVFKEVSVTLYSGVAIFVVGRVIDAVVYKFDYSKVALIISKEHETIAKEIGRQLDRGATYLKGQGSYTGAETKVVLTAVKRQQVADLKQIVSEIDPDAFVIMQEAHQVLGDGFSRYTRDSL